MVTRRHSAEKAVQHHRAFWSAVVLQAHHDIKTEPLRSTDYEQAVAFFTAPGEWRDSLGAIADMLDLHPDDLARTGTKAIKARRLAEGLPEIEEPRPPVVRKPVEARRKPTVRKHVAKWHPPKQRAHVSGFQPQKSPVSTFKKAESLPIPVAAPAKPRTGKFGHAVQWDFDRNAGRWVHRVNGVF
jgi:hypothetical protein